MQAADDPSTERLLARIRRLEEALRRIEACGSRRGWNYDDAIEAFEIARAALNPDPPDPGTSDSQDTFD